MIITGVFHFEARLLSLTDTDPPDISIPQYCAIPLRSNLISFSTAVGGGGGEEGGSETGFRDRGTKSGERSMNRSRRARPSLPGGKRRGASSDAEHVDGQGDDPPRGVVTLVWVADASSADSARVRVASRSGGTSAPVARKRGAPRRAREDRWGKKSLKGDVSRESERTRGESARGEKGEGFLR